MAEGDALPGVREPVVCPQCGTPGMVSANRRDASDFCAECDFPLFWTPTAVIRGGGEETGDALRRLPGTAGRVTVASRPCPTCAEANIVTAEHCVRCGGPMVLPPPAAPAPEPVPAPAPLPEPEPEPEPVGWHWPALVVAFATLVALVAVIVVTLQR